MSNEEKRSQLLRRFILNAPAGELAIVLKSLYVVAAKGASDEEEEQFFRAIPFHCLEYAIKQHSVFQYEFPVSEHLEENGCKKARLVTTRFNHVASLLGERGVASVEDDSEAAVAMETLKGRKFPEKSRSEGEKGEGGEEEEEGWFVDFRNVFVDPATKLLVEIDPVEEKVIRLCTIEAAIGAVPRDACPVLFDLLSKFSPDNSSVIELLSKAFESYAKKVLDVADNLNLQPQRTSSRTYSTLVAPIFGAEATSFALCLTSLRCSPHAFWSGRWRSVFLVEQNTEDSSKWKVRGEIKINMHYHEDGNVHMESSHVMPPTEISVAEGEIQKKLAKKVVKVIEAEESQLQSELDSTCHSIGERVFKGLRRRLPITKQLFDFSKEVSNAGVARNAWPAQHPPPSAESMPMS